MKRFLIAILIITLFSGTALGFSAGEWKKLSDENKLSYAIGVVEAWKNLKSAVDFTNQYRKEPSVSPAESIFIGLVICIDNRNMTNQQIYDAVDAYVSKKPELHNLLMSGVVWNALSEVCKKQ